jgi:hypothetical protein
VSGSQLCKSTFSQAIPLPELLADSGKQMLRHSPSGAEGRSQRTVTGLDDVGLP